MRVEMNGLSIYSKFHFDNGKLKLVSCFVNQT